MKPKATILIVEDSFIVSYHLQTTLESEGFSVIGKCDSGEAAIALIEAGTPDLVLMDIMLSGKMDGIETAAWVKQHHSVPVVYITALTDKETISRAKLTEPYGYLTKPFEDREIFTVIEMALYKHNIESRLKQSEEKYLSTVNSIGDCVITIDRDYVITFMNPSAMMLTQYVLSDALGKMIMDVVNLKNEVTGEISINPLQCPIGSSRNRWPNDLILIGRQGLEVPIGESSMSPLLDNRGDFIGLIIIFKDLTERKEHERLLKEIERNRLGAMMEGQEKERARIAKDLHDGLGQMLNAIKMNAKMNVPEGHANDLSRLLDDAIQESIRISENLLPSKLKDFDLSICLRSLCNTISKTTKSNITFEAHGKKFEMPQSQKINFYRIAQEAVNNALKHSKASGINVQLNEGTEIMRLIIEDNGTGLPPQVSASLQGKNGLVNMRDRVEIMGGRFFIESDQNRGTLVTVEVPTTKLFANGKA